MHTFSIRKPSTLGAAVAAGTRGGRYIAGGTTLVDLMREEVEAPERLVDISDLPLRRIQVTPGGALSIGSLVTMTDLASHTAVRQAYPVVVEALEQSASAQLRNMASIGGNLLQRTRCTYFRDLSAACNKREPGSGCSAIGGVNRGHAILGGSSQCVATHASDLAVALVALDASVVLRSDRGSRTLTLEQLLLQPGETPQREHGLRRGELITTLTIPAHQRPLRSGYLKVRDRASYEFALCSVAVTLVEQGGTITRARVAAGGVGTVPWRLREVEELLEGSRPSDQLWQRAGSVAVRGARPLSGNEYKVGLLARSVERQLATIGGDR